MTDSFSHCEFILFFIHRNGDGFIDREEFGDILHLTGEPVVEEDIDEMFGESDTNKDGKIDFDGEVKLHVQQEEFLHSCRLRNVFQNVCDIMRGRGKQTGLPDPLKTFSVI